jgi:lauroyl/myristoyl acyltransferase
MAICYRIGPAKWKVIFDQEIPTFSQGERRSVESITKDVNRAFERAIHRDPLNWFWVHDRWKRYRKLKKKKPVPPAK